MLEVTDPISQSVDICPAPPKQRKPDNKRIHTDTNWGGGLELLLCWWLAIRVHHNGDFVGVATDTSSVAFIGGGAIPTDLAGPI